MIDQEQIFRLYNVPLQFLDCDFLPSSCSLLFQEELASAPDVEEVDRWVTEHLVQDLCCCLKSNLGAVELCSLTQLGYQQLVLQGPRMLLLTHVYARGFWLEDSCCRGLPLSAVKLQHILACFTRLHLCLLLVGME